MGLYAIKLSAEVSAVPRSEQTNYCPILSEWDLLVTFSLTLSIHKIIDRGIRVTDQYHYYHIYARLICWGD